MFAKLTLTLFIPVFISILLPFEIYAKEGRLVLSEGNQRCEGLSIWDRNEYKIIGKCFGLVYPFDEQLDNYVLWVKHDDGVVEKVGEIDKGLFDDSVTKRFNTFYITAENDSNPRTSGRIIMSGNIEDFNNSGSNFSIKTSIPEPTGKSSEFLQSPSPTSKPSKLEVTQVFSKSTVTGIVVIGLIIVILLFFIRKK